MAEASQSGEISYSYSNAVGSPTVPDAVPIAGVTGDTKSGTITAPDGYYIVSVTGDQYSVVYTDETHQEATYSVILMTLTTVMRHLILRHKTCWSSWHQTIKLQR